MSQPHDAPPLGFEVPVYRAATERIMMGGIPREASILIGTLAMVFVQIRLYALLLLVPVVYLGMKKLYERDAYFLEVWVAHLRTSTHLRI